MEENWEYAEANTQDHVHGLHLYPARMIPQIANRLIKENSSVGQTILDPFCGSGSVLAEALILGRNAVGLDINPLAIMISKAKTSPISPDTLGQVFDEVSEIVKQNISLNRENKYKPDVFYFKNIHHWFNKDVVNDLSIIKESINKTKIADESIDNLLKVCFSATLLKTSNIAFADNPYFARAKKGKALEKHAPNVLEIFEQNLQDYRCRMRLFYELHSKNVSCRVIRHDSRNMPLKDNSIDLVVTSPPYGEESHTMSYSRFTKLSLLWLGYSLRDINKNESTSLGGTLTVFRDISPRLRKLYDELAEKDSQRAKEVFSFFWDYEKCLMEIHRVLRPGCLACIVIGDRSALGLKVSNGEITEELAKPSGFIHKATYHRKIPKKVLPRSDYKVDLINEEDIILLGKA
jgi:site-specific DNA-methyltransferase (cytosine-N4-specific)